MSVGIDWTSHALHCGDDSVRVRSANNNKRQRESEMMMSESGCFMFSCSRLWFCVFLCVKDSAFCDNYDKWKLLVIGSLL